MPVGWVEVGIFEMRRGRQHDIAMGDAFGHRHVDADREHILAREAAAHPILIGMHDNRVVVVDEDGPQRRIEIVLGEMPPDIEDVERAGARGHEIRPLQSGRRLREGIAGA